MQNKTAGREEWWTSGRRRMVVAKTSIEPFQTGSRISSIPQDIAMASRSAKGRKVCTFIVTWNCYGGFKREKSLRRQSQS
jgi:hypothetical protein